MGSGDKDKREMDLSIESKSERDRRGMRPEIGSGPNAYERA